MARLGLLGCFGALILIVIIGGVWYVGVRNNLVQLDEQVNQQWAQVESQYQRRYDLIPNLVATVQGAANFEKSTIVEVTQARARVGQVAAPSGPPGAAAALPNNPAQMEQFANAQAQLTGALSRLLVVVERYPELKSNQNFLELQSQLEGTENRIAVERQRYNEAAQVFNTKVKQFPASIVAGSRFPPKAYFKGVAGSSEAPKVDFGNFGAAPTATASAPAPTTATVPATATH